jgi:hypothetical protein
MPKVSKNAVTAGAQLAIALLTLLTSANAQERREGRRRIKSLSLADHVAVMRVILKLDFAACDSGASRWIDAEYWGRGVDLPTDESKVKKARPGRRAGDRD